MIANTQWLHVDDAASASRPLLTARVERIRANYTTARSFLRVIGRYVSTDRDPSLYLQSTTPHDGTFNGSVLLAYKINGQSVMYVGYGDDRTLTEQNQLARSDRQVFVRFSYACQR